MVDDGPSTIVQQSNVEGIEVNTNQAAYGDAEKRLTK